jgi:hypothetical protein
VDAQIGRAGLCARATELAGLRAPGKNRRGKTKIRAAIASRRPRATYNAGPSFSDLDEVGSRANVDQSRRNYVNRAGEGSPYYMPESVWRSQRGLGYRDSGNYSAP